MAISIPFAARQVLRFGVLAAPPDDVSQEELAKALRRYAVTEEHAIRMVDAWIQSQRFWPKPVDIAELAETVAIKATTSKPDKSCPACFGSGWEQVWTLETSERYTSGAVHKSVEIVPNDEMAFELLKRVDGKNQRVYSNVRRCTYCRYGKELADQTVARNPKARIDPSLPVVEDNRILNFPPPPEKPGPAEKVPPSRSVRAFATDKNEPPKLEPITADDIDRVRRELLEKNGAK